MMATAATPSFWHSLRSRLDTTAVRATVVLAVLLALAHALTLFLMTESIMRPQAERLAAIMASNVEAIVESARRMPPDQQEQFLKNLWNSPYLRVHLDQEVTPEDTGSPSMLETLFMTALSARMSESQHFEWRRGTARTHLDCLRCGRQAPVGLDTSAEFAQSRSGHRPGLWLQPCTGRTRRACPSGMDEQTAASA
jgi:hypothetical protein